MEDIALHFTFSYKYSNVFKTPEKITSILTYVLLKRLIAAFYFECLLSTPRKKRRNNKRTFPCYFFHFAKCLEQKHVFKSDAKQIIKQTVCRNTVASISGIRAVTTVTLPPTYPTKEKPNKNTCVHILLNSLTINLI